jgi:hypothetical protein
MMYRFSKLKIWMKCHNHYPALVQLMNTSYFTVAHLTIPSTEALAIFIPEAEK